MVESMSHYVYILYSEKCNRYYVGSSKDPQIRLVERHNKGYVLATKNCKPYVLKKVKEFDTEKEALEEERRIKRQKSRIYIEQLLEGYW
jgi:GIY-YIG catalytic domain.